MTKKNNAKSKSSEKKEAQSAAPRVDREEMIAVAAYYKAEQHRFLSDPFHNWLEAEQEIKA